MSAKSDAKDIAIKNLKGFFKRGAAFESSGNIPTGHFDLDFGIHYGFLPSEVDLSELEGYDPKTNLGLPLGKLVELFGEEGAGKSSLAYRVVGYAQKLGYDCCWIDTEHSFSENLADINGVDYNELIYSNMSNTLDADEVFYAEDVFDAIVNICKTNGEIEKAKTEGKPHGKRIGVIVLDSVANLVPKVRMENDAEKQTVGLLARLMSDNLGKIANWAAKFGVLVIFINQLREKIGVMWGNPETTPGGRALKHACSVRLKISKSYGKEADINKTVDGRNILVGRKARVTVEKNRLAKPFRNDKGFNTIEIPIFYQQVIADALTQAIDTAFQCKILRRYKGNIIWGEEKVEGDKEQLEAWIKYNSCEEKFIMAVAAKAKEDKVFLPPEMTKRVEEIKSANKNAAVSVVADDDGASNGTSDTDGSVEPSGDTGTVTKKASVSRGRKKQAD